MTRDAPKTGGLPREKSIQSSLKPPHGQAHVLFDHVAGNAQSARDFFLMQVLEPAHHEDLPAPRRQAFDGGLKPVHQLFGIEARIRRGRGRGEFVQRLLIIAVFLFRSAAAREISGEDSRRSTAAAPPAP